MPPVTRMPDRGRAREVVVHVEVGHVVLFLKEGDDLLVAIGAADLQQKGQSLLDFSRVESGEQNLGDCESRNLGVNGIEYHTKKNLLFFTCLRNYYLVSRDSLREIGRRVP